MFKASAARTVGTNGFPGRKIGMKRRSQTNRLHPNLLRPIRRELTRALIASGQHQSDIARKWGVTRANVEHILAGGGIYSIARLAAELGRKIEIRLK